MSHRSRMASTFGLLFSHNRVAIFIEPKIDGLDTDLVRKKLVMPDHQKELPWNRWGLEFKENMPNAIRDLESELNDKAQMGNDLAIQKRISEFMKENRLPRFESSKSGNLNADIPDSSVYKEGGSSNEEAERQKKSEDKSNDSLKLERWS